MNSSENISNITAAMVKVQAELEPALMNQTNSFLGNRYADLGVVIETAKPVMEKYGLAIMQFPIGDNNRIGLRNVLVHGESGEWISADILSVQENEKGKSMAQVAGSIISYLRRYSVASILGMYSDEDNDGNRPQGDQKGSTRKNTRKPQDPRKVKVTAVKRGWIAYASEVGLMENIKDEQELGEFNKVMADYIGKLDTEKDLEKLAKAGNKAMDLWRKNVTQETVQEE